MISKAGIMRLKHIKAEKAKQFVISLLIVIALFLVFIFWPRSFAYSQCGQCEMLGLGANIERIESFEQNIFGITVKAIVNTTCYQKISAKHKFENGTIKIFIEPLGESISNHCLCDREIVFNMPNYPDVRVIELYYEEKLMDKRSVFANSLSDGSEFCESDARYRALCYYRLAFMKKDPSFCDKTPKPDKCKSELDSFLTLKCLELHSQEYCNNLFLEKKE